MQNYIFYLVREHDRRNKILYHSIMAKEFNER
jgi:hypothetical protein